MAGKPRSRYGASCTAIKKNGERCRSKMTYKGNKCKHHGGLSLNAEEKAKITEETGRTFKKTGPATSEGWARTWAGFYAHIERLRAKKKAEKQCQE